MRNNEEQKAMALMYFSAESEKITLILKPTELNLMGIL